MIRLGILKHSTTPVALILYLRLHYGDRMTD